jgi:hypothetical protein
MSIEWWRQLYLHYLFCEYNSNNGNDCIDNYDYGCRNDHYDL